MATCHAEKVEGAKAGDDGWRQGVVGERPVGRDEALPEGGEVCGEGVGVGGELEESEPRDEER